MFFPQDLKIQTNHRVFFSIVQWPSGVWLSFHRSYWVHEFFSPCTACSLLQSGWLLLCIWWLFCSALLVNLGALATHFLISSVACSIRWLLSTLTTLFWFLCLSLLVVLVPGPSLMHLYFRSSGWERRHLLQTGSCQGNLVALRSFYSFLKQSLVRFVQ